MRSLPAAVNPLHKPHAPAGLEHFLTTLPHCRLKCLRNNFVLHLLNLVDFGLLQATDTVGLIEMVDRMRQ